MVVWVALSPKQREIYAAYLGGESVKDVLSGKVSSPLAAIQHLKKVRVESISVLHSWVLAGSSDAGTFFALLGEYHMFFS